MFSFLFSANWKLICFVVYEDKKWFEQDYVHLIKKNYKQNIEWASEWDGQKEINDQGNSFLIQKIHKFNDLQSIVIALMWTSWCD